MNDMDIELDDVQDDTLLNENYKSQPLTDEADDALPNAVTVSATVVGVVISLIVLAVSFVVIIFLIVWLIAGTVAYDIAFMAKSGGADRCKGITRDNTPSEFRYYGQCANVQDRPRLLSFFDDYFVPKDSWRSATFHSRADKDNVAPADATFGAWLLTQNSAPADRPWIIAVHGINVCKANYAPLLHSGMLWHAGYNVMVIDLRNHGESPSIAGNYVTYGSQEHFDALGAFDYLSERYPNAPIGIVGQSMGGATATIAFAREPRFKAAFIDSGVCDVEMTLVENGNRYGWGRFFTSGACAISVTKDFGCPPFPYSPTKALKEDTTKRPIFFEHGYDDKLVPISNSQLCSAIAEEQGMTVYRYYTNVPYEGCDDSHILSIISDPKAFNDRITGFFARHLPL